MPSRSPSHGWKPSRNPTVSCCLKHFRTGRFLIFALWSSGMDSETKRSAYSHPDWVFSLFVFFFAIVHWLRLRDFCWCHPAEWRRWYIEHREEWFYWLNLEKYLYKKKINKNMTFYTEATVFMTGMFPKTACCELFFANLSWYPFLLSLITRKQLVLIIQ